MQRQPSVWSKYHPNPQWKEYPEGSMYAMLATTAKRKASSIAIEFAGVKIKYSRLIERIDAVAKAFVSIGLKRGDYISLISPNMPQAVFVIYAANRLGVRVNVLHPLLSAVELQDFIENVGSKAVVILDQIYPKIRKFQWKNIDPAIILFSVEDEFPLIMKTFYRLSNRKKINIESNHTKYFWKEIIEKSKSVELPPDIGQSDEDAVILYSGGTTGVQKGVILTNLNMNAYPVQIHDLHDYDNVYVKQLAIMPIFHGFGLGVCVHGLLCNGQHIFLVPKYDLAECAALIYKRKINFLYGVPALYEAISRSEWIEKKDLSFIKQCICAGDFLPEKLQKRFDKYLEKGGSPTKLRNAYGQTECVCGCTAMPFFKYKEKSVGLPFPDTEIKIVEVGTQKEVPAGTKGEICVHGITVMKGYYNHPEETKRALQQHSDGKIWLHTGDLGYLDEEGYLYCEGRLSRMLITSGYNVFPAQIESCLATYPAVKECCVIGANDPVVGKRLVAYIVFNGKANDKWMEGVKAFCRERMAEYSVPQEFIAIEELPKSSLKKIDYKQVEAMYVARKRGSFPSEGKC